MQRYKGVRNFFKGTTAFQTNFSKKLLTACSKKLTKIFLLKEVKKLSSFYLLEILFLLNTLLEFQLLKRVGHPLDASTLYGPLHNQLAVDNYKDALQEAVKLGGKIEVGGNVIDRPGFFVEPTIVSNLPHNSPVIMRETFAPIVYVLKTKSLEQAIEWNNEVDQGLSSALFTNNIGSTFKWITENGSDCGIVNINTSPSGKKALQRKKTDFMNYFRG